jgi:hypothetical protein
VYFPAQLNPAAYSGTRGKPAPGARCIGAAESSSPTGPFTVQPHPVVCLKGYGAADDMTASPGKRVIGEGAIDADPVIINNSWDNHTSELFLVYKTQSGTGQATIRMVRLNLTTNGTGIVGLYELQPVAGRRPSSASRGKACAGRAAPTSVPRRSPASTGCSSTPTPAAPQAPRGRCTRTSSRSGRTATRRGSARLPRSTAIRETGPANVWSHAIGKEGMTYKALIRR